MHLVGLRFRRGAPGGEVANSHRTQRLTKLLVLRVIPLKREIPSLAASVFVRRPSDPRRRNSPHLDRDFEERNGRPCSVAVLLVAHDNPDAVELDCVKSVFIGKVVADVDRHMEPAASIRSRIQASVVPLSQSMSAAARRPCARSSHVDHLAVRACVWQRRSRRCAPVRPRGSEPRRRSAYVPPVLRESPPGSRPTRPPHTQGHRRRRRPLVSVIGAVRFR